MKILKAKKVFLADMIRDDCAVLIKDDKIKAILPNNQIDNYDYEVIDYKDNYILPGLIDTHIHGAVGYDTMDASIEAIEKISEFLAKQGTTSWQPTTVTANVKDICRAIENVKKCLHQKNSSRIIGVFIEGPYLTEEHRGAHNLNLIRKLDKKELEEIIATGLVNEILIAPEKENSLDIIRWLTIEKGIKVGLGHSSASYEDACSCMDAGADGVIHTFCGMGQFHHRKPNLLGAALIRDDIYAEIIADGIHVSLPAMKIFFKTKKDDKAILVSDAIRATGLADGRYMLGSLPFNVKDGIARIDNGSLAGSTTTLLKEVKMLIEKLKIDPLKAVNMASLNPARRFNLMDRGCIREEMLADLIVVNDKYEILDTFIGGKSINKKS